MRWMNPGFAAVVAAGLFAAPFAAPAAAQVGASLPPAKSLHGLAQTDARQLADFSGRLLLIEYFAYW